MQAFPSIGGPIFVPRRPAELARLAPECFTALEPCVRSAVETFVSSPSPESLLRFEEEVLRVSQAAASHVVAGVLQYLNLDPVRLNGAVAEARTAHAGHLRHRGFRLAPVQFLGGPRLLIFTREQSRIVGA